MIPNYIKPQSFIRQILQVLESGFAAERNAFIYGPSYRLSRYTDETERESTVRKTFSASGVELWYSGTDSESLPLNERADQNTVEVYAEDLQLTLGSPLTKAAILSPSQPTKLAYVDDSGSTPELTEFPEFSGSRKIRIGDIVLVDDGTTTRTRTVTAVTTENGDVTVLHLDGTATTRYLTESWDDGDELDPGNLLTITVRQPFSGKVPPASVTVDADKAAVAAALTIDGRAAVTDIGQVFLSYRALQIPSATADIVAVRTNAQINSLFGKIDPDNTLAFGLSYALRGSQGKQVYGAAVRDPNDAAAWSEILTKAEQNENLYAHTPLTYRMDVLTAVANHVEAMSNWDVKRWRRAYVATDNPTTVAVATEGLDGNDIEVLVDASTNLLTVVSDNLNLVDLDIQEGDLVRLDYAGPDYAYEWVVQSVLGSDTLLLKSGQVSADIDIAVKAEFWQGDTGRTQVRYAVARSRQLGTRRAINVWTDRATILEGTSERVVENIFLAAEIAGLRSAVLPHQGLTRTEIRGASAATLMRTKYTEALLNEAAANGVFIITQDAANQPLYIRHQLTTDVSKGSLYYEDSVGTNIDEISFAIEAVVKNYIGRYNATPDTVRLIRNRLTEVLFERSQSDRLVELGPQILEYDDEQVEVEIDPVLRDQINVRLSLVLPLPLNRIVVDIFAGISFNN
jgi:hypothetical protein